MARWPPGCPRSRAQCPSGLRSQHGGHGRPAHGSTPRCPTAGGTRRGPQPPWRPIPEHLLGKVP
eukprot:11628657-Heterocapsa_arctica.AAC.1